MMLLRRGAPLLVCLPVLLGPGQPASSPRQDARIWVGRHHEIEEYLRTAECVSMEVLGPSGGARCTLRAGGPFSRIAWRPLRSGAFRGFRESYKAEIAAYEVDKLLEMDMVPPSVERQLGGSSGAAELWVEGVVPWNNAPPPGERERTRWAGQLVRMRMFDDLIGNSDRNAGNMLHDAAWHLILVDHSRAFGVGLGLPQKLSRIDKSFWAKIERLTRAQLEGALGPWLDHDQIEAVLARRDRMRAGIGRRRE
jgi:hypothetical protein